MADLKASGQLYSWPDINRYYDTGNPSKECPTKKEILALPHKGINWDSPDFNIYDDTYKSYGRLGINPDYIESIGENEGVPRSITPFGSDDILSKTVYRRYIEVKDFNQDEVIKVPKEGATLKFKVFIGFAEYLYPDFSSGNNLTFQKKKSFKFDNTFLYVSYRNTNGGISDEVADEYYKNKLTYSISPLVDEEGYFEITITINSNSTDSSRNFSKLYIGVFEHKNSNYHLYGNIISTKFPTIEQEASIVTWEYNFFVQNSTFNFMALGGKTNPSILGITSNKQMYINGKPTDTTEFVDYTIDKELPSWLSINEANEQIAAENKTESSRTFSRIYTQNESGKKFTITYNQAAGVKTYGPLVATQASNIPDIPASGGTAGFFTYSYEQPWGWNGDTTNGGIITSGATERWTEAISGSNLGTTPKPRIKLGTRTLTLTLHGGSELGTTITRDVYQAANAVIKTTQGVWEVSIFANPSTFTEQGGTSQISASARAPRTNTWSSGATNEADDAIGTPILSIPTPVTGFSLSDTILTVAENTTPDGRSVVVRATMDTVYKEVTVTQSSYLVEWRYYFTTSTPTLNFDALGTTIMPNLNSYREKYINGSLVEGSTEGVPAVKDSTTGPIKEVSSSGITLSENTTTQARTGTVVYRQTGSDKTITITCNQAAGTVTTREVLVWINGIPNSIPSEGGSVEGTIQSGYWDVINGKNTTFHPVAPEVTKPNDVDVTFTRVSSIPTLGDRYNMTISTSIPNNSESSRVIRIGLAYGSKTMGFNVSQLGATVTWDYTFAIYSPGTKILNMAAKPTSSGVIEVTSYRTKVVNGTPTSTTEPVDVTVDSIDEDWVEVVKGTTTGTRVNFNVTLLENRVSNTRGMTVTFRQVGTSNLDQVDINQAAATVTTRDFIDYIEPIPSGSINSSEQVLEVTVESYRETLINGSVSSKVAVIPTVDLNFEGSETGWATVNIVKPDSFEYRYIIQIEVAENTTNNTRNANIMPKNGSAEPEYNFAFTQDAAIIQYTYDIWYIRRVNIGTPTNPNIVVTNKVTEVELEGAAGSMNGGFATMELVIEKIPIINGVARTPIRISSEFVKTSNSLTSVPSGQITANLASTTSGDITDAIITIYNSVTNLAEYPRTHTVSFYRKDITIDGKVIGQTPDITVKVNPIPYTRDFVFNWKIETGLITNITLSSDTRATNRNIISYVSLKRDNVEFTRKYIKPTFIPPSEDWLQIIDRGQNPDNTYNYVIRALTDNEGESARSQSVRFEQPGNGNQALQAYVSQTPKNLERWKKKN